MPMMRGASAFLGNEGVAGAWVGGISTDSRAFPSIGWRLDLQAARKRTDFALGLRLGCPPMFRYT